MNHRIQLAVAGFAIIAMSGCGVLNPPDQKAQAKAEWNDARAGVLETLANDQYRNGTFDKAQQTLAGAIALSPNRPSLHVLAAKLAIEQGRLEAADHELQTARALDPKSAEVDYLAGVLYQRWQQPAEALSWYEKASGKVPGEASYVLARAEMLVALARVDDAIDLLQRSADAFEHTPSIHDAAGQLLLGRGRYAEAAVAFRAALALAGDDDGIREHLSLALVAAGQFREAGEQLARLTKNPPFSQRVDLLLALGECQFTDAELREARATFESATNLDTANAAAWLGLAKSAFALSDPQRADLALHRCIANDGANAQAYLLLGYLRLKQHRSADALDALHRASLLDPSDTTSVCLAGYALDQAGRHDAAVRFYARALRQDPHDALAARLMANADAR